jgi:hypothetical protein
MTVSVAAAAAPPDERGTPVPDAGKASAAAAVRHVNNML